MKINDYIYTRDLWDGNAYNNGTQYSALPGKFLSMYLVCTYTLLQKAYGGFAPQGWSVPWNKQWRKMISNISEIAGSKPDGSIGASFLKNGVYGLNLTANGFLCREDGVTYRLNSDICYVGALADTDFHFWDGVYDVKIGSLTSRDCNGVAISPEEGTVSLVNWRDARPYIKSSNPTYKGGSYDLNKIFGQLWELSGVSEGASLSLLLGYNLILCQQVVK